MDSIKLTSVIILIALLVFIVIIVILTIGTLIMNKDLEKSAVKIKEIKNKMHQEINNGGGVISKEFTYEDILGENQYSFMVDNTNQNIYTCKLDLSGYKLDCFSYKEICGFEIFSDGEVTGGIGRAVLGGVLAGGVGAIVGAQTARKKIKSYMSILYLSNVDNPKYEMIFISSSEGVTLDNEYFKKAVEFNQNINATIKAIINNKVKDVTIDSINEDAVIKVKAENIFDNNVSAKERLSQLKELYDNNLITREDYIFKKEEILKEI